MLMWDQGHCGVGSGMSLLAGRVRGTLAWAHAIQEDMYQWVLVSMLGHQYLLFSRLDVDCVLEWCAPSL